MIVYTSASSKLRTNMPAGTAIAVGGCIGPGRPHHPGAAGAPKRGRTGFCPDGERGSGSAGHARAVRRAWRTGSLDGARRRPRGTPEGLHGNGRGCGNGHQGARSAPGLPPGPVIPLCDVAVPGGAGAVTFVAGWVRVREPLPPPARSEP